VLAATGLLWAGERLHAQEICDTPEHFTQVDGRLPRVALMAAERKISILVEGTGSSTLGGPDGPRNAYPARLEAALAKRLPDVKIVVRTDVKMRRTAKDMVKALEEIPPESIPGLVIWQTGTVEAIRQMDPIGFRDVLDRAVRKLRANGIDVLLVNMQYSPRTDAIITEGPYAEAMQWVAQQQDVPLFDRLGVMRHWSQSGVFDLSAGGRNQVAERVHDCIGRLLAEIIVENAGLAPKKPKASH
jgi:hypothetical protein